MCALASFWRASRAEQPDRPRPALPTALRDIHVCAAVFFIIFIFLIYMLFMNPGHRKVEQQKIVALMTDVQCN